MREKLYLVLRKISLAFADIILVVLASFLTNGEFFSLQDKSAFFIWLGTNALLVVTLFAFFGLYNIIFSSFGGLELVKNILAVGVLGIGNILTALISRGEIVSFSAAIGFSSLLFCLTACMRSSKRFVMYAKHFFAMRKSCIRVMVVGGGEAGSDLIKEMKSSDKINYKPVCVIDDAIEKKGRAVHGVRVVGTTEHIVAMAKKYEVQEIFVTMPSVNKKRISEIVKLCQGCYCPVKILPGIYQLATGQVTVSNLREVDVQDLLGREQVNVKLDEIMGYIERKIVLVTGGGGSIGSELCRQIASHNPKTLIILDSYENNAYDIEQELKLKYKDLDLTLAFHSAPQDVDKDLQMMYEVFGDRDASAVREITKLHEEVANFRLKEGLPGEKRGEYVLLVAGAEEKESPLNALSEVEHIKHYMLAGLDKKEALKRAAKDRGVSKSALYPFSIDL